VADRSQPTFAITRPTLSPAAQRTSAVPIVRWAQDGMRKSKLQDYLAIIVKRSGSTARSSQHDADQGPPNVQRVHELPEAGRLKGGK
jgi:hypothetical protein